MVGIGPATPVSHQSSSQEENDLDSTSNVGSQAYGQRIAAPNSMIGSNSVWPPPPRLPMGSEYRHTVPPPPSHFGNSYGAPTQPGYIQTPPYMGDPPPAVAPGPSSSCNVNPNQSIIDKLAGEPQHYTSQEYEARRHFFQQIVIFCEKNNCPLTQQPTVSRQPVDLYVLYQQVKRRGGFEEVSVVYI